MDKALDDLVEYIKNSSEYIECVNIKKKMSNNEDITSKVKKIKVLQKKLLQNPDLKTEDELRKLEKELNEIPLYVIYNQKLNSINEKINYINDELNEYFYKLLNEE